MVEEEIEIIIPNDKYINFIKSKFLKNYKPCIISGITNYDDEDSTIYITYKFKIKNKRSINLFKKLLKEIKSTYNLKIN